MFKNKILIVITLVVLITVAFVIKYGGSEKAEIVPTSDTTPAAIGKAPTVDSVLENIRPIVEWESDEYSRGTILWNTENEELKLEGRGYLFGDVIGSEVLREKHDTLKVFLRDSGFEHD